MSRVLARQPRHALPMPNAGRALRAGAIAPARPAPLSDRSAQRLGSGNKLPTLSGRRGRRERPHATAVPKLDFLGIERAIAGLPNVPGLAYTPHRTTMTAIKVAAETNPARRSPLDTTREFGCGRPATPSPPYVGTGDIVRGAVSSPASRRLIRARHSRRRHEIGGPGIERRFELAQQIDLGARSVRTSRRSCGSMPPDAPYATKCFGHSRSLRSARLQLQRRHGSSPGTSATEPSAGIVRCRPSARTSSANRCSRGLQRAV